MKSATVKFEGPSKGSQVAVKCINRADLPKEDEEDLLEEVSSHGGIFIGGRGWARGEREGNGGLFEGGRGVERGNRWFV